MATGNTFFNPTVQAVIPSLTTEAQRLAANSVSWSTGRLVQILASAVSGGLIAITGTDAAFVLNAITFLMSALLIFRLAIHVHAGQLGDEAKRGFNRYLSDAREGFQYAIRDRLISSLLVVQALRRLRLGRPAPCSLSFR